jgi:hypothetical protein
MMPARQTQTCSLMEVAPRKCGETERAGMVTTRCLFDTNKMKCDEVC